METDMNSPLVVPLVEGFRMVGVGRSTGYKLIETAPEFSQAHRMLAGPQRPHCRRAGTVGGTARVPPTSAGSVMAAITETEVDLIRIIDEFGRMQDRLRFFLIAAEAIAEEAAADTPAYLSIRCASDDLVDAMAAFKEQLLAYRARVRPR